MPIEFEIRDDTIVFVTRGEVDYQAGIAVLEAGIAEAGRRDPTRRYTAVFDIRESTEQRSAAELRGIADLVSRNSDVLAPRMAVIAGDDFHFALGRVFGAYADRHGVEVAVLRSLDQLPA